MGNDNSSSNTGRNGTAQLDKGLRFVNSMIMKTKVDYFESLVDLHGLIDLMIAKGLINSREFVQRREMIKESLRKEFAQDRFQVELDPTPDKYQITPSIIDCDQRYPLCKARCCTLRVTLSSQDLDEGIARWEYASPYSLAASEDGYCVHLQRPENTCAIYENRPAVCRAYSCKNDERIWKNFESKTPAAET